MKIDDLNRFVCRSYLIYNMQDNQNHFLKDWLITANSHFRKRQAELAYEVKIENHKLDAKLGIAKNFMRLTNKALIGMNKIHFNRAAMFSGVVGLFCGWLYSEADQQIQWFADNHQQTIKEALIKQVLRSQAIKSNLNEALLSNVYTNPDVQYKLHEILMRNAILPQKSNLFQLINTGVIKALESEQVINTASKLAAKAITQNGDIIAKLSLQFLDGQKMLKLTTSKVSAQLQSEEVNEGIASAVKELVLSQLQLDSNKEVLYEWIRQNFINW